MKEKERLIGLDLVRTAAILLVMLGHSLVYLPATLRDLFRLQSDGVTLFFVLSGFLVGGILLKSFPERPTWADIFRFWLFRWGKTLPSYYVVLLILASYYWLTKQDMGSFSWKYFFFVQNLFSSELNFFNESWSLSVEEWFYLTFPLLFLLLCRFSKQASRTILLAALFYLFFSLGMRLGAEALLGERPHFDQIVVYRLDAISLGILAAFLRERFPAYWQSYAKILLAAGLGLLLCFELAARLDWELFYPPVTSSFEALTFALCLPFFSGIRSYPGKSVNRLLVYVSKRSYTLYLLNLAFVQILFMPFFFKYLPELRKTAGMEFFAYWLFSFIFAEILYRCVENPVLNFRERFR